MRTAQFGPPFANPLPTCGAYGLRFKNAAGALSTSNKDDYKFDRTQVGQCVNRAGDSFTMSGTLPTITANLVDGTASEMPVSDSGTVRFKRTGCKALALDVSYTTSGTAINGTDYKQLSGTATIPINSANANVTVTAINDTLPKSSETAILKISTSANYTRVRRTAVPSRSSATSDVEMAHALSMPRVGSPKCRAMWRVGDLLLT